jgi:hypothetical protein
MPPFVRQVALAIGHDDTRGALIRPQIVLGTFNPSFVHDLQVPSESVSRPKPVPKNMCTAFSSIAAAVPSRIFRLKALLGKRLGQVVGNQACRRV